MSKKALLKPGSQIKVCSEWETITKVTFIAGPPYDHYQVFTNCPTTELDIINVNDYELRPWYADIESDLKVGNNFTFNNSLSNNFSNIKRRIISVTKFKTHFEITSDTGISVLKPENKNKFKFFKKDDLPTITKSGSEDSRERAYYLRRRKKPKYSTSDNPFEQRAYSRQKKRISNS
jgi:hypothetical protein